METFTLHFLDVELPMADNIVYLDAIALLDNYVGNLQQQLTKDPGTKFIIDQLKTSLCNYKNGTITISQLIEILLKTKSEYKIDSYQIFVTGNDYLNTE